MVFLTTLSCNSTDKKESSSVDLKCNNVKTVQTENFITSSSDATQTQDLIADTLDVIVVQCANGYEYAIHNYDFNPIIESELDKLENINVKPFPFKTLMGISYQGVFDKKYCPPIIEKVNVDFFNINSFYKGYYEVTQSEMKWGYELRIVNTKTLEQINSITAYNLDGYKEIEKHIIDNIQRLNTDIEKLK